ncbi:hypothetical protein [Kiritimatiella glycovorans]|uniref:Uncharacterized protein n=1 Tax=Kiritimatiella glycovorans TaxID=1307763 RepID=A0A0G3EH20_9BACT|nr:hypothetical protein [Kiritimatiella glycovorans]AKJ65653.1 hypothetical protein L21SP4_02428 [Kiritimatiella glycovorans]
MSRGREVRIAGLAALMVAMSGAAALSDPAAWIRFDPENSKQYHGRTYHFLGDAPLYVKVAAAPKEDAVLDLLWGAKNDQRVAILKAGDTEQRVRAGGYDGFRWQRVELDPPKGKEEWLVELRAANGNDAPAFLAALRLTSSRTAPNEALPDAASKFMQLCEPPPSGLDRWAQELQDQSLAVERRALIHGLQASEALRRCRKFVDGWAAHCDPKTGLVPRNLRHDKYLWNGQDSAADNYPFMVLTAALTDQELYKGRMLDILRTEEKVATLRGGLPADYDFRKQDYRNKETPLSALIFAGSEYVKDGLMPITEWLGDSPWSERMKGIIDSILRQAEYETPYGNIPSGNIEVNGEMMQVLSRLCFRYNNSTYLDMACRIADYYLLGDRHPTRDAELLHLRDHNCELISGLTEVYAACHFLRKEKATQYKQPIHWMLDDILKVGVNEHGLMYQAVNLRDGSIVNQTIHDNWGYNYNGFYTVYLLDGDRKYREACRFALSSLKEHYWKHKWQGLIADGIADSVEGALNLFNREPDAEGVPMWIDANINWMLDMQKPDGVIEGWHGDGNYARTAIMWALWKQQGATIRPWREDVKLGAVREGNKVTFVLRADAPWKGTLRFDRPRHAEFMHLPLDYPRINQFPEWYTIDRTERYSVSLQNREAKSYTGVDLMQGLPLELGAGETCLLRVIEI